MGLFRPGADVRAVLPGPDDGERRQRVGRLELRPDGIAFVPLTPAEQAPTRGLFTRADRGWAEGLHPLDRFLKNTHEILGPLNRLSAQLRMTDYQRLTPDGRVRRSVFGDGQIEVVANLGERDFAYRCPRWGELILPPHGFLAAAPTFLAFHARTFQGLRYEDPPLFVLQSADEQPLERAARVRIYHGFGDPRLRWGGEVVEVKRELLYEKK
jgi:hypothetical protein